MKTDVCTEYEAKEIVSDNIDITIFTYFNNGTIASLICFPLKIKNEEDLKLQYFNKLLMNTSYNLVAMLGINKEIIEPKIRKSAKYIQILNGILESEGLPVNINKIKAITNNNNTFCELNK